MTMELLELEKWQRDTDLENLEGFRHGTRAAPTLYRAGIVKAAETDAPTIFIASDEEPDRHGDTIAVGGWDTKAFEVNPVFLWFHGMDSNHQLPIGRVPKVWGEGKQLLSAVTWDKADPFAAEVQGKYQRGFLKAVSVGFRPLEYEEIRASDDKDKAGHARGQVTGIRFLKQELLEISAVPIPANPRALQKSYYYAVRVVPVHTPPDPIPDVPDSETSELSPLASILAAVRQHKEALIGPGGK